MWTLAPCAGGLIYARARVCVFVGALCAFRAHCMVVLLEQFFFFRLASWEMWPNLRYRVFNTLTVLSTRRINWPCVALARTAFANVILYLKLSYSCNTWGRFLSATRCISISDQVSLNCSSGSCLWHNWRDIFGGAVNQNEESSVRAAASTLQFTWMRQIWRLSWVPKRNNAYFLVQVANYIHRSGDITPTDVAIVVVVTYQTLRLLLVFL